MTYERNKLEYNLFRGFLIPATVFCIIILIQNIIVGNSIVIPLSMGVVMGSLLLLIHYRPRLFFFALVFMFIATYIGTISTFINRGEMEGLGPFLFIVGLVVNIILFHGWMRKVAVGLILAALITLIYYQETLGLVGSGQNYVSTMRVSFPFILVLLSAILIYLKNHLHKSRRQLEETIAKLKELNDQLYSQSEELTSKKNELENLNVNLESVFAERSREINLRNEELSEYAYVNAHLLRAPLARVLGLTNLLEHSGALEHSTISAIKFQAEETDSIVRKINKVLS